jgi:hypothetical protein
MERARGNQNIRAGYRYSLRARATRKIKGHSPNIIINLQLREGSLKISKYGTITLGARAVPKFKPD